MMEQRARRGFLGVEAVVVGGKGTGQCGHRIQPKSVECFDPKINVAIGLRPDPLARMTEM